jgi:DNA polymerase-3 subunit beta
MRTAVLAQTLRRILSDAARFNSDKVEGIPQMFELVAEDDRLFVNATDFERTFSGHIGAKLQAPGRVVVSAKTLLDLVQRFPDERIDLEYREPNLIVTCNGIHSSLRVFIHEFPTPPVYGDPFQLDGAALKKALDWTMTCAAKSDQNPMMRSVLFHVTKTGLTLAAADSYRLAIAPLGDTPLNLGEYIVPLNLCRALSHLLDESPVEMLFAEDSVVAFRTEFWTISGSLLDGKFPAYAKQLPKSHSSQIGVPYETMMDSMKIVAVLARDSNYSVRLEYQEEPSTLVLSGASAERGEVSVTIHSFIGNGESFEIALNCQMILEIPELGEALTLKFQGSSNPMEVEGEEGRRMITMPMSLKK